MDAPRVSIVVPCYNAARFLAPALDSCLGQSYPGCEVIAVDDGSLDGTREQLARYEARHGALTVLYREHGGVSAARNAGMDAAQGTHLLFVDADDVLEPDAVARLVAAMCAEGADGAIGDRCNFWEGTERRVVLPSAPYYLHDAYASCVRGLWFHSALLSPRGPARWTVGRAVWEALEYMLLCFVHAPKVAYLDRVVINVRQHDSPERFSARQDHFEPAVTGAFFLEQKARLRREGALTRARAEALDQRIVDNACTLVRRGRSSEAGPLLAAVSWEEVERYDWYRPGTFAGAVHLLGPTVGSALFYRVNRALGRL